MPLVRARGRFADMTAAMLRDVNAEHLCDQSVVYEGQVVEECGWSKPDALMDPLRYHAKSKSKSPLHTVPAYAVNICGCDGAGL